jgi:hypothetical protein
MLATLPPARTGASRRSFARQVPAADLLKVQVDPPGSPTTYLKGDLRVVDGLDFAERSVDCRLPKASGVRWQRLSCGPPRDPTLPSPCSSDPALIHVSADGGQLFIVRASALEHFFGACPPGDRGPQLVLTFPRIWIRARTVWGQWKVRSSSARLQRAPSVTVYVNMAVAQAGYAQSK